MKNNTKKGTKVQIRVTNEEKLYIEQEAAKYEMTQTDWILSKLINNREHDKLHTLPVMRTLYNITELLYTEIPKVSNDQEFNSKCRKVVDELWQYLK